MIIKYYLTCDVAKEVDNIYLSVENDDGDSIWQACFTITPDYDAIGKLDEDFEYSCEDEAIDKVINILRSGDPNREVIGSLIDDTNYGEWTVINC